MSWQVHTPMLSIFLKYQWFGGWYLGVRSWCLSGTPFTAWLLSQLPASSWQSSSTMLRSHLSSRVSKESGPAPILPQDLMSTPVVWPAVLWASLITVQFTVGLHASFLKSCPICLDWRATLVLVFCLPARQGTYLRGVFFLSGGLQQYKNHCLFSIL